MGALSVMIGLSLHDKQLDKVTLKAFRHINKLTIDSIDQLKVPDESIDLLMEIMVIMLMR